MEKETHPFFVALQEANAEALTKEKKDNEEFSIPTPERMAEIRKWHDEYRKNNPKASKRNAKRATIRKFNLTIKK